MANKKKPPGFSTQKNIINQSYKDGKITKEERAFFIEDLNIFASDGKISATEKNAIAEEINISQGIFPKPPSAPPPPSSPTPPPSSPPPSSSSPTPPPAPVIPATPALPPQPPPPAPPAIPLLPQPTSFAVKQADPDIIVFDEAIDPDFIVESFFEEFGGTELIKISRSDLIFSSKTDLINIKNIEEIQQIFSSKNIIPIKSVQNNFARYGIDLFKRNVFSPFFDDNGNLIIEIGNVRSHEVIDVEVLRSGTIDEVG
jgi:hypothetical protein